MIVQLFEGAEVFPAPSLAFTVYLCEPSATAVSVFDHVPALSVVVVPMESVPSKTSTVLPASADPDSHTVPVVL